MTKKQCLQKLDRLINQGKENLEKIADDGPYSRFRRKQIAENLVFLQTIIQLINGNKKR